MRQNEVRYEAVAVEDAELIVVAFGIAARVALSAQQRLRKEGFAVGLFRPVTLFPFPEEALQRLSGGERRFLVLELNAGQMVEDVRLSVAGNSEVLFYGRPGGAIVTPEEVYEKLRAVVMSGKAHMAL
jgi:2-oxoglutarate ferredoxin oxidoreductase subunit alpha